MKAIISITIIMMFKRMFICIYHSIYTILSVWCTTLCASTATSRRCMRPYCAATATSRRCMRPYCAATATSRRCRRPYCAATATSRRCRRPYCAATATLRRSHCALIRTVFVLSMHKERAVTRRSMRPHRVHWRCHCVAAALIAFPRLAGWLSGFV